jgi:Na+-driven multidrug efflux pump
VVLAFFMHFGYSMAASTHVGNLMGAGKPRLAKLAVRAASKQRSIIELN